MKKSTFLLINFLAFLTTLVVLLLQSYQSPEIALTTTCFASPEHQNWFAYQHPNKNGQSLKLNPCDTDTGQFVDRRKKLSSLYLYPGDPSNWKTWDNQISSVEVRRNIAINLYRDNNFEGPCISLFIDDPNYPNVYSGYVNLANIRYSSCNCFNVSRNH